MNQSSPPARMAAARRLRSRTRRMITTLCGLAVFLAAAIGLAPLASAILLPPDPVAPAVVPASTPPIATAADLPVSVIMTLAVGTVLMSVATTLATLALIRRRDRRLRAADPAQATVPAPALSPEEPPGPDDDILVSHPRRDRQLRLRAL